MTIPEYDDPIALFREWLAAAEGTEPINPNAMAVATVDAQGVPSIRTVLLKAVDDGGGFVFYTNLESQKGDDLRANPRAAACFYWRALERQVRIEGRTTLVDEAEADAYFATRPRGSQIAAWASAQSRTLERRAELERAVAETEARFEGGPVPRPPFWSGYRIVAARIEFWHSQPSRLHDRLRYDRQADGWQRRWLNP